MNIEVLVATMRQTDFSKVTEMNIQTDVLIANQDARCAYEERDFGAFMARMVTTDTVGASLNRDLAIFYARGDVVIFADDDQIFTDDYAAAVREAFSEHPDADAVKFYCESRNPERPFSYQRPECTKMAGRWSLTSAGVHAFAVKRSFLLDNGLLFDVRVGPGRYIYCGEDSQFLNDLRRAGARIYLSDKLISYAKQDGSSWFEGYTERYFISAGYTYQKLYGLLAPLAALRRVIKTRRRPDCNAPFRSAFTAALKGIRMGREGTCSAKKF